MRFGAPIRVVGLHFAYNALILKEEAQLLASSLSRAVRLRFVTHHGGKIIFYYVLCSIIFYYIILYNYMILFSVISCSCPSFHSVSPRVQV
jgi:hypothetical protein